jgi:uncharacterized protein (DUF934 family)
MPIIDKTGIVTDRFTPIDSLQTVEGARPIISWDTWTTDRATFSQAAEIALIVDPDFDVMTLRWSLNEIGAIFLCFNRFADGRPYSQARLLRKRLDFQGQIRATGDVLRDQILLMKRCGIDTFELRHDQDPDASLLAFDDFSVEYQSRYSAARGDTPPPRGRATS